MKLAAIATALLIAIVIACSGPKNERETESTSDPVKDSLYENYDQLKDSHDPEYDREDAPSAMVTQPPTGVRVDEFSSIFTADEAEIVWWTDQSDMYSRIRRPAWTRIKNEFPSKVYSLYKDSESMYRYVGGMVFGMYEADPLGCANTCALRLSRAFNYAGITIPHKKDHTFKGKDHKYYFLSSPKMYKWLTESFGVPDVFVDNKNGLIQGKDLHRLVAGKKGIFVMQAKDPEAFGAYGHVDLFEEQECLGGKCYFEAAGGTRMIALWVLND